MNIDLFLNPHGESGLLLDRLPMQAAAGVIYDAQTREMTVELQGGEEDPLHLNIPVEDTHTDLILLTRKIYIGAVKDGQIGLTLEVPLFYLNDPYGASFADTHSGFAPRRSLKGFEQFMKRCSAAQPIHRVDLGNEDLLGSVLRGMDPRALEFVPELLRQQLLENVPHQAASMTILQNMGPAGMGNTGTTIRKVQGGGRSEDDTA